MHISLHDIRSLQVEALLSSCRVSREQQDRQEFLATATYLSDLVPACAETGIDISAVARNAVADALWIQGEASTSIHMLHRIVELPREKNEISEVHRSRILAKLVRA